MVRCKYKNVNIPKISQLATACNKICLNSDKKACKLSGGGNRPTFPPNVQDSPIIAVWKNYGQVKRMASGNPKPPEKEMVFRWATQHGGKVEPIVVIAMNRQSGNIMHMATTFSYLV